MKGFEDLNPRVLFIYFILTALIPMFCMNPAMLAMSVFGSVLFFTLRNGSKNIGQHIFCLGLFVLTAAINPLFFHNGATVLFVMNDNPVTLEAALYGLSAAAALLSVLYWFRSFSQIMTSDRLLYIFGSLSPKISLVLSMTLRYIPLFGRQAKKIKQSQKALGIYSKDNIIDDFRAGLRIFSILTTWGLENGIITANSMSARGYGIGPRTHFSLYKFRKSDCIFLTLCTLLFAATAICLLSGALTVHYYPEFIFPAISLRAFAGYAAYGLLVLLPSLLKTEEYFKWKYLRSKI